MWSVHLVTKSLHSANDAQFSIDCPLIQILVTTWSLLVRLLTAKQSLIFVGPVLNVTKGIFSVDISLRVVQYFVVITCRRTVKMVSLRSWLVRPSKAAARKRLEKHSVSSVSLYTGFHWTSLQRSCILVKSMKSCSVSTPVNIVKLSVRSFALYVRVDNF